MPRGRPPTHQKLLDREFLCEKYLTEKWSTVKIAKLVGCDPKAVNYKLRKYGIVPRNFSESHRIDKWSFTGDKSVLYGSLLGDGSLLRRNKQTGQGQASFSKKNVGYDHVCFVGWKLLMSDPTERITEYHPEKGRTQFKFTTRNCVEFLDEYQRWYPSGDKVVPHELILDQKILLHWFLDDGHCCWKNEKKTRTHIGFSTESFSKENCEYLCAEFGRLGCAAHLGKSHAGHGHVIALQAKSHRDFFDLIGPCPAEIPSMIYKWKIPCEETK